MPQTLHFLKKGKIVNLSYKKQYLTHKKLKIQNASTYPVGIFGFKLNMLIHKLYLF